MDGPMYGSGGRRSRGNGRDNCSSAVHVTVCLLRFLVPPARNWRTRRLAGFGDWAAVGRWALSLQGPSSRVCSATAASRASRGCCCCCCWSLRARSRYCSGGCGGWDCLPGLVGGGWSLAGSVIPQKDGAATWIPGVAFASRPLLGSFCELLGSRISNTVDLAPPKFSPNPPEMPRQPPACRACQRTPAAKYSVDTARG